MCSLPPLGLLGNRNPAREVPGVYAFVYIFVRNGCRHYHVWRSQRIKTAPVETPGPSRRENGSAYQARQPTYLDFLSVQSVV